MAVAALVVVSIAGLANWAGHWGMFLTAVPLAGLALVVTLVQQAVRARPA